MNCCCNQNEDVVGRLLDLDVDVNFRGGYGITPLITAASLGLVNTTKRLVVYPGIDLGLLDEDGLDALKTAKRRGFEDVYGIIKDQMERNKTLAGVFKVARLVVLIGLPMELQDYILDLSLGTSLDQSLLNRHFDQSTISTVISLPLDNSSSAVITEIPQEIALSDQSFSSTLQSSLFDNSLSDEIPQDQLQQLQQQELQEQELQLQETSKIQEPTRSQIPVPVSCRLKNKLLDRQLIGSFDTCKCFGESLL
jgi:ABC-type Na+ efflux pump permease subunit